MPRLKRADYIERVHQWIEKATQNPEMLYTVTLTDKHTDKPIINVESFAESIGFRKSSRPIFTNYLTTELEEILEAMRSKGLITSGVSAYQLNQINRLKLLLRRIEGDRDLLKRIEVFGNSIKVLRLVHEFPDYKLSTGLKSRIKYKHLDSYYSSVFEVRLLELLQEEGLYNSSDYLPVAEREVAEQSENVMALFRDARESLSVASVSELDELCTEPFDALFYLAALGARGVSQPSSISNFLAMYQHLKKFFQSQGLYENRPILKTLNEYTPLKFRAYLEDFVATGELSPSYSATLLSCLQLALDRFIELEGAHDYSYIKASGFDVRGRTTDQYRPYPKPQRETIAQILQKEIQSVWERHSRPYLKTDIGETFLITRDKELASDGRLCTEENLRWFFDHQLDGKRITQYEIQDLDPRSDKAQFYRAVCRYRTRVSGAHKRLEDLYESWHVPRDPYREEIFPFYMRLLQVTGMNPNSALDLEVDSFEPEHPATLKPCLRYWKERSTGAKELHLDIFDSDITWLTKSQASTVSDIINKVAELTKGIRSRLPDNHEYKNLLFIASGKPPKGFGQVKKVFLRHYGKMRDFLERKYSNELIDAETGELIRLVGTRFRSSLVSELVESGVSIREVQLMLGHGSITTTLTYLDRMDFNRQARVKIQEKLIKIYENSWALKEGESLPSQEKARGEIIFKTPLGGCANIFNPPDFIKNSKSYDGGACSNFNKCLSCENVIITRSHLPDLFALLRDYRAAWEHGSVAATPYGSVIRDNISILESILGDQSEFEHSELEEAERLSRYIDSTVTIDEVSL